MSVEYRTGDLFDQRDVDALAHGVNTVGAMGSGIAPQFKRRFPDMYAAYREACRNSTLTVGGIFPWQVASQRWAYNLASQQKTGRDARLDAIDSSLRAAVAHAREHSVRSLALPRIGAGIGGLRWADVKDVIEQVAGSTPDVELVVVTLPSQSG